MSVLHLVGQEKSNFKQSIFISTNKIKGCL